MMGSTRDRNGDRCQEGEATWVDGGSHLVLVLSGSLDTAAIDRIGDRVLDRVRKSVKPLYILDMKDVDRVSSSFIRLLILLAREIGKRDAALFIVSLQNPVRSVLELSRLDRFLCLAQTVEEAVALWRDHLADAGVKARDFGSSEFTAIGFHKLSGRLGRGVPFLSTSVPPWPTLSTLQGLGFGDSSRYGFVDEGGGPEDPGRGPVFLGKRFFRGGFFLPADSLQAGFEVFPDAAPETRDLFLFGTPTLGGFVRCRWPEKGVPLSELLADRLALVAKAQPDATGLTGFLLVHDLPGRPDGTPGGTACGLSLGVVVPSRCRGEGTAAISSPADEGRAPVLRGVTLVLQVPFNLDFNDLDVLPVLERCLSEGRFLESLPIQAGQPAGRAVLGLSFSGAGNAVNR